MLPPTRVMNARRSISLCSPDDFVSPQEQRLRDGQTESLGGLEVDHELEPGGLLDGQIGRLGALENLVDERRHASELVRNIRSIGHQTTDLRIFAVPVHRW